MEELEVKRNAKLKKSDKKKMLKKLAAGGQRHNIKGQCQQPKKGWANSYNNKKLLFCHSYSALGCCFGVCAVLSSYPSFSPVTALPAVVNKAAATTAALPAGLRCFFSSRGHKTLQIQPTDGERMDGPGAKLWEGTGTAGEGSCICAAFLAAAAPRVAGSFPFSSLPFC
jgi:hypothetical protein